MADEGKIKIIRMVPTKIEALSDAAKKAERAVLAGGGLSSQDDEDPDVLAGLIDRTTQPTSNKFTIPQPVAKQAPGRHPTASPAAKPAAGAEAMSFGEVNLGGDSAAEIETTAPAAGKAAAKGTPKPPARQGAGAAPAAVRPAAATPEKVQARPSVRPLPKEEPEIKRSYAREIKIVLIVLVILAAIGGGVYAYMQYRAKAAQEAAEENARLDQGSLDNLKDQATKKVSPNP